MVHGFFLDYEFILNNNILAQQDPDALDMLQNGPNWLQNKRKIPYPRLWLVETVAILKVNEV